MCIRDSSWVWKKATEKSRYRLFGKITTLFEEINEELSCTGMKPVSYTHLLPEYGSADGNADSGTYMDGDEQALVKQIDFVYPDGAKAVSYTHLDVYKRQRSSFINTGIPSLCAWSARDHAHSGSV